MSKRHYLVLDEQDRGLVRAVGLARHAEKPKCAPVAYVLREVKGGQESFVATNGFVMAALRRPARLDDFRQLYTACGNRVGAVQVEQVGEYPSWVSILPRGLDGADGYELDAERVMRMTEGLKRVDKDVWIMPSGGLFYLLHGGMMYYFCPKKLRVAADMLLRLGQAGFAPCCRALVWPDSGKRAVLQLEAEAGDLRWVFVTMSSTLHGKCRFLGANLSLV